MNSSNHLPSLPELALQYGTITKEQFSHLNRLESLKKSKGHTTDFESVMISQKFATAYQVGLLKLIQEYQIIKRHGEEFGKIAIEKGFATQNDVDMALEAQKKAFKEAKIKLLIGDIMVETHVITVQQKESILQEQAETDLQAEKILDPEEVQTEVQEEIAEKTPVKLGPYEKKFLKIQALDRDFAASVIEKGLATKQDVKTAQEIQAKAFEKDSQIRLLGAIMVDLKFITSEEKELILTEQKRRSRKEPLAPAIRVDISEDRMEAGISILSEDYPVKLEDVKQALKENGVKYGIYPDALLQCNLDLKNMDFIAAKQDFSMELIKSRKARYSFNTGGIDENKKQKGETLAEQGISCDTYLKKDLFGDTVEQERGMDFTFRCDSGTRLSKDGTKAFAGKTGFPSLSIERKLFIHPPISVLEDADLRYGPLESYANLSISGVLTGAYPVTAGHINAEEIRGARIEAVGDVKTRIGITEAVISAQGDVYARYLHNCRIETFGNVYIENEIIDSEIFASGKIICPKCHVVGSNIYGKKGVELFRVGNERTRPCMISAGTEHHILEKATQVSEKVKIARIKLDDLIEEKKDQEYFAKKNFQRMVELKIFHDRAKEKKEKLTREFKLKKNSVSENKLANVAKLISSFDKRMKDAIYSLKKLNQTKAKYDKKASYLSKKIEALEPSVERATADLKIDLFTFFEWARKTSNSTRIKIHHHVYPGTTLKGIYSSLEIKELRKTLSVKEVEDDGTYKMLPVST